MPASSVVRGVDPRTSGGSVTTTLAITHTLPAGAQAGDLLIVGMQLREPTTTLTKWRVPAGWTARTSLSVDGNGSYAVYTAKYGTDVTGTSWTWDNGAGNTTASRWSSCLVALNGSQVSGVAGHAAQAVSSTTTPSSPTLTTAGQSVLVGFAGSRTSGGVTYTAPSGWVEQSDVSESTATNAATLEVSVNDTTPVAAGTYSYAPTASATIAGGFASITAFAVASGPATYPASTASFPNPERGPFYYSETHYQGGGTGATQTDSFTGTNGAAPSAANWTVSNSTGSTATIQNNALQLVTGTAGAYNDVARLTSTLAAASDVHLTFDVTPGASTEAYFDVMLRAAGSGGSLGQAGYKFEVGSWGGISLSRVTGYTATGIGGSTPSIAGYAVGTVVHVDIQTSGSTLTFSAWTGATKPATPMISVTDTTYTAAGNVGFYLNGGNVGAANTWTVDNWSATTGGGTPAGYTALSGSAVAAAVAAGQSQVFRYFYLEAYNSAGSTIDSTYLALLDADLATVRANGAKIILRFAYSGTDIETYPYGNPDPGPTTSVAHIQQLAPTLNKYADVIEAVEAGFIGIWGEWYYTTNYTSGTNPAAALTAQNWADRRSILTALLSNLDARIFVLVRYAGVKPNYFQQATIPADATNAGYWRRMGYHDDAEGASTDDWGTFSTFPWSGWTSLPADAQSFVQTDVQTYALPWGGEVASNTVTYSAFKAEMQRYRANFWNPSDFGGSQATQAWSAANLTEVGQSLGYRLRLVSATLPNSGTAGTSAAVSLVVANDGWSTVLRNRPVVIDFVNGATVVSSTLAADPRTWAPGAQTTVSGTVTLPATAGTWAMHLRFPDPSANLAANAAYCIQLANTGVWDAATGRNALGQSVVVSGTPTTGAATGSVSLGGSAAVQIGPSARGSISLGGTATASSVAVPWTATNAWNGADLWPGPDTPGTVLGASAGSAGSLSLGGSVSVGVPAAPATATGGISIAGFASSSTVPAAPAGAFGSITLGYTATVVPVVPQSKTKTLGVPLDIYRSGGYALYYTADAYLGGSAVAGATGLRPSGGSITDTMRPGVRRTLNLQLAPTPGLYDLLKPTGTQLRVYANVRTGAQSTTRIPMGVFTIDSQSISVVDGSITITAPDLWQQIVRSKFIGPQSSITGLTVVQQIAQLIREALGASTTVTMSASSTATMSAMTWEKDRAQAIIDLATSINAWVYVDRSGNWVIADVPTLAPQVKWLIDANPYGVLVSLDRQRSRTNTYNVVCVEPQSSSTPSFPTTWVWDSDYHSDTYAGPPPVPGPIATYPPDPAKAGPFGLSVYYYDTSLPLDPGEAGALAFSILAKTTALASQVSLTMGHNPNVDAGDICGVLPPPERYDIPRYTETHMAETVTHPLTLDNTGLKIDGRSSRTDPYS